MRLIFILLSNDVRIFEHGVMNAGQWMTFWHLTGGRLSSEGTSEQENEGLRFVNFVMDPTARLLDTNRTPFFLEKKTAAWHISINSFRQKNMSILIFIVLILLGIFNLVWEVWHFVGRAI